MKVDVIKAPIPIGSEPVVESVIYELHTLLIGFDPDAGGARFTIRFKEPRAFRCVDEGDLASYWQVPELKANWLFEIVEGGWLDNESDEYLDASKTIGFREFLVCSIDDCITVLCDEPPEITLHPSGEW